MVCWLLTNFNCETEVSAFVPVTEMMQNRLYIYKTTMRLCELLKRAILILGAAL